MPTKDTFLKAMNKGLIDQFARQSASSVRILFFNYILLGALDAHEDRLDDAIFWRDAAVKTLGDLGAKHPTTRTLEEYVQRRRDLKAASDLINSINGSHALPTLESSRKALEENSQARALAPALFSLRELEASTRDWSDGEFRAAGIKIENAVRAVDETESNASITLTAYRAWLMDLMTAAADLHANARRMAQVVDSKPVDPPPALREMQRTQVDVTTRLLGPSYAGNLRQWLETYEQFLAIYTDPESAPERSVSQNSMICSVPCSSTVIPLTRSIVTGTTWSNSRRSSPRRQLANRRRASPKEEAAEPRPFVRVEPSDSADEDMNEYETVEDRPRRRIRPVAIVIAIGGLILLAIAAVIISRGVSGIGGIGTTLNATSTVSSRLGRDLSSVAAVITDEAPSETPTVLCQRSHHRPPPLCSTRSRRVGAKPLFRRARRRFLRRIPDCPLRH